MANRKLLQIIVLLAALALTIMLACDDDEQIIGGRCEYAAIHGTLYVDSLAPIDSIQITTDEGLVQFWCHFMADGGDDVGRFGDNDTLLTLFIYCDSLCELPPWLPDDSDFTDAAVHAIREEVTMGACEPVNYQIPMLSEYGCPYQLVLASNYFAKP